MRPNYFASSALIHVSFLAFLFFLQGWLHPPSGPGHLLKFEYMGTGGGGNGNAGGGGGPKEKDMGQIVPQPPKIEIPDHAGPSRPKTIPSEEGRPEKEQSPIVRVGVSKETKPGNGGPLIGPEDGGMGKGVGVGIGDASGNGFGFGSYLFILRQRIWAEWTQSMIFGSNEECVIAMTVFENGRVSRIQLEERSDNPHYDDIAMRAIRNASPLPPLPPNFPKDKQRFRIKFKMLD